MVSVVLKPELRSKFRKVKDTDDFEVYEYTPSLIKAFPFYLERVSTPYRVRCILEYFFGYKVFYIRKNDEWMGYCIVSNGRNYRYKFCNSKDITFGRYFIAPKFRGRGLGVKMIRTVLTEMNVPYEKAYAYVHAGNKASHATLLKIGCREVLHFDKVGFLRRIVMNSKGKYTLYCYEDRSNE